MKIDILTLFPEMFKGPFDESIIRKAIDKNLVEINIHNLRDWTSGKHKTTDDRPFGGGKGMILMIEPIYKALKQLKSKKTKVILLSPQGKTFNQKKAKQLAKEDHLILICGHYEGVDERIRESLIDEEVSIGEYILTGGELPAMVLADSIIRLLPNVLEKEATAQESFEEVEIDGKKEKLLDYPQYTKPADFKGLKVPEVLLSGNHQKIKEYRLKKAIEKTRKKN
ncbi:tRNA (guanosine(37)-N1)-methyltransferase TrmD [Patescibacteria group bacterium]|nr:tRNA (guanosine(37)-N1)-methyltransferase TrmD [Patescibacteria group bacterium]